MTGVDEPGTQRPARPALDAAPGLLGAILTTRVDGETVSIRIVEVEAYEGAHDPGSHAYRGRTARNEVMFGPPGHLYIYRHLGLHHCANIVSGEAGVSAAVLLRAGEVIDGAPVAWRRRCAAGVCRRPQDLARGPGRLTVALGLNLTHNGVALSDDADAVATLRLPGATVAPVRTGPRVGVSGPGGDPERFGWRFFLASDPHVSDFRAGTREQNRPVSGP